MQREQIEQAAEGMMQMALDNLERDGYVAFGALLVSKNGIMPLILERVDAEQKERLGEFLRAWPRLASTMPSPSSRRRGRSTRPRRRPSRSKFPCRSTRIAWRASSCRWRHVTAISC